MKILLIADSEQKELWSGEVRQRMADIDLILSAGDLSPFYLEFLVTMLNVPLLYVRGNHDDFYEERPPEGCVCIEDNAVVVRKAASGYYEVSRDGLAAGFAGALRSRRQGGAKNDMNGADRGAADDEPGRSIVIAGLGGSMRYRPGSNMYTEEEMAVRVRKLSRLIRRKRRLDILLTHSPCRGYGDMDDRAHTGFECFGSLLGDWHPAYHCYGHVHQEYGNFRRKSEHPSGAVLVNGSGYCVLEI